MKPEYRPLKWHHLKVWPEEFVKLISDMKSFEFRKNDRDFRSYDYLVLEEWNPETKLYTGRCVTRGITSILKDKFGVPDDFVVLSLRKV